MKTKRSSPRSEMARVAQCAADGGAVSDEPLREEAIERFNQVERRIDSAVASVTDQLVEQRSYSGFGDERLEKAFTALSAGIVRLERKLDRILALVVESRGRR
jgi:hypothetical protein